MPQIFLPKHVGEAYQKKRIMRQIIVPDPVSGRETIVLVPSSEFFESRQHEQEVIQQATEDAVVDMRAKGKRDTPKYPRKEIGGEIGDFIERRDKKQKRTAPRRYEHGF